MAQRFAQTLARSSVVTATAVVLGLAIPAALPSAAPQAPGQQPPQGRGAAQPAVPCGPKAQLQGTLANNVDTKSRCFELRIYTVDQARVGTGAFKGGIDDLHQRFREKEVAIFQKHGAEIVGVWQHLGKPDTLVWMLAYRDRAHRDEVWAKFGADPEWTALRTKYNVPVSAETFMMSATDYSLLK
jgi:hypothetical protein